MQDVTMRLERESLDPRASFRRRHVAVVAVPSPGPVALPPRLDLPRLADPGLDEHWTLSTLEW